jgi:hypothetical protein
VRLRCSSFGFVGRTNNAVTGGKLNVPNLRSTVEVCCSGQ